MQRSLVSQAKQRKRREERSESDGSPSFSSPLEQAAKVLGTSAGSAPGQAVQYLLHFPPRQKQ